jgi:hypothetical protein
MSDDAIAKGYVDRLVDELRRRGLRVAAKLPALTVMNPALSGVDSKGQQVLIRHCEGRGLMWYWVWPGLRPALRGEPMPKPEVEPMCPAEEIQTAADRITKVVRLDASDLAVTGSDA